MKKAPRKSFIIIGRANAGKTLFLLNFCEFMGYNDITIKFKDAREEYIRNNEIGAFKKNLVNDTPNSTKCIQATELNIPVFKGSKYAEFIDTTGLSSTIHFDQDIREGMAQTISLMKQDAVLFHIVDAAWISDSKKIDDMDMQIYKYGKYRGNYIILANKLDLIQNENKLHILDESFPEVKIIKISALKELGFPEVKKYVSKII
ncbi:GTPase Der [Oxobacter pfennigii]|uniref:GTPase Der n=1 Tax=Oxobacter pfennigii TaxID=36849 RepID=A0A0P8YCG6_9CLOT|nr:GTPase [Oxobacter pfennigii]KPU44843.1 GTPase Der [Oxobacter pfennigii]